MNHATRELLSRVDVALLRMAKSGHQDTSGYCRLLQKRNAIAAGAEYTVINVSEKLIGGVGSQLASISRLAKI